MSQKNFQSAKIALLKMITTETFENNRLPSEATLAKKLRVSIVTLRQALSLLAAEGYITKRQGLGNFVHESALNQHMRTDLTYCVENLLLISGYQVQIEALANGQVPATKEESVDLKIGEGSNLLQLQILTRADGKPAALEIHRIPMHHLKQELPNGLEVLKLEEFLWDYCERELAHEMTSWIPTLVDKRFSTLFDLTQGSAMLYWEELLYDTDDTPVCHTYTYFNPNIIKPRSLRKWNFGPRLDEKL
jgi:GntR family transcriptional regulator